MLETIVKILVLSAPILVGIAAPQLCSVMILFEIGLILSFLFFYRTKYQREQDELDD